VVQAFTRKLIVLVTEISSQCLSSIPLQVNNETRYTVRILGNALSNINSALAETFGGIPDLIEELVTKTKSRNYFAEL
jgi:hypothetical protein